MQTNIVFSYYSFNISKITKSTVSGLHYGWVEKRNPNPCMLHVSRNREDRKEKSMPAFVLRSLGKYHMGGTVVGVYYRTLDQEEEINKAFYRQLKVASCSWLSWKPSTTLIFAGKTTQSSTNSSGGFHRALITLTEVMEYLMRKVVLLELVQQMSGRKCEGWRQPGLQWLWDGRITKRQSSK